VTALTGGRFAARAARSNFNRGTPRGDGRLHGLSAREIYAGEKENLIGSFKFDGTDYIGVTLNFVDIDNNWRLMSYRMKLSTAELADLMFNGHARHGIEIIGYEKTSFTEGMKAYLDGEARRRNRFLPLMELSHRSIAKQTRIQQALERRYIT
jgi:hypothetical protein